MSRVIAADVLDSRKDDWTISDDGTNRGPITTWRAPTLPHDNSNPALGPKARLTTSGLPDAYAFLRPMLGIPKVKRLDLEDEEGPDVPTADVSGLASYRTVPKPLVSSGYYEMGADRYEAGMLVRFLSRTDAGALDSFSRGYHASGASGLIDSCGFIDDAGMPQSWYDVIGRQQDRIIQLFKNWSGGTFRKGDEDLIRRAFVDVMNSATSDTKWNFFNVAKNLTFKLLDQINRPIISGPTAAQAMATMMSAFGRKSSAPAEKLPPTVYGPVSPDAEKRKAELTQIWKDAEAHHNNQGGGVFSAIGGALSSVGSGIASVGKGVVSVAKGIATPVAALVTSPIKLAGDIASGKNVFVALKDTVKRDLSSVKEVAPYVQAAISVIPGVGAGVNAAIAAGAALAQGQPITSALVAGLKNALPGGPIAAQAFDTAYNVIRGQNLGDAALQALVDNAPGGVIGKQAAQAAVAVAKGQNLQQAALGLAKGIASDKLGNLIPVNVPDSVRNAVSDIAQGKNVLETAKAAVGSQAMASFSPFATGVMNNAGPRISDTLKGQLPSILPNDVKMVASSLLATPSLRNIPVEELARKLNVSTHAVRDGMGAVLQAVQKSGGSSIPSLSYARSLASRIPMGMSFDRAMPAFASKVGPKVYSHNVATPAAAAARLRRAGAVFHALTARGLDCGALDPKAMPTIRQGSSGEAVIQWQKILGLTADGKFGPNTHAATVAFQKKNGLGADGIVGLKTWTAGLVQVVTSTPPQTVPGTSIPITVPPPTTSAPIIASTMPTIRRGSTGAPVKTWQTFLQIASDGVFGPNTEDATKSFQAKNGLTADGIVGPKTWEKAMSGTSAPPVNPPPPPVVISTPPVNIPPMTIPIPGMPPISTPPVNIPPVVIGMPPGLPPVVTQPPMPPNPPGQPPPPPPITTSPPGTPPVVIPPLPPGGKPSGSGLLMPVAVGLGILVLAMSGSRGKLL
jgi:peptidoglycan hydrolase-like protein with peptidoglycan-binding domain